MKLLKRLLLALLFPIALFGQQQNFGNSSGSGITSVSSLPGTCTLTSAPVQLTVSPGGIYTCDPHSLTYVLDGQLGGALLPGSFGVKADWQIESTGANFTVTSGSPTVTCTTCAFTSADTGKEMFFTNWNGADNTYGTATSGPATLTTITFVNATTVTLSQNANFNAGTTNTNNGVLAWGHDDDPASNSPWTAVENAVYNGINCQNLQFSGITNLAKAHFITATCRGISGGSTASKYPGITGFGVGAGATFLLPPWFNFTGCTGATSGTACFGLGEWANVSFNTLGAVGNISAGTHNVFETFNDGTYKDLAFWGGFAGTNYFFYINGGYHFVEDITVDGGVKVIGTSGNDHDVYGLFAGNGTQTSITVNGGTLGDYGSAFFIPSGTGIGVQVVGTGTYFGHNTVALNVPGVASACWTTATGYIYLIGAQCNISGGAAGSVAVQVTGAGYAYATGSILAGGASGGAYSCAATSFCEDGRGNTYPANALGLAPTVTGTIWGTGPTITLGAGNNTAAEGSVLVTEGTGTPTTGTMVLTFNQTFSSTGNPPSCSLNFFNGTGSWNARIGALVTTRASTAITWTVDNNAATLTNGSTYGVTWLCTPR